MGREADPLADACASSRFPGTLLFTTAIQGRHFDHLPRLPRRVQTLGILPPLLSVPPELFKTTMGHMSPDISFLAASDEFMFYISFA